ncbi:receptor-like kinase in flowers 1 [Actinidia rufa]|uniref:non-specific serine/threonine protein kinase n=1 Tax=Actinidia rufa TaxID=165716 RepID=A0A7J0EQF6_9ERIC|nr:receptor-like kinase in flowers 1 [Actinidia rufa]
MLPRNAVFLILGLSFIWSWRFSESKLPPGEVDALRQIATTMGAKYWQFNNDLCQVEKVGITPEDPSGAENSVECDCKIGNGTCTYCHVVTISVMANRLSGEIPNELGNFSSLTYLRISDINGTAQEFPKLSNTTGLIRLFLSGNMLSGNVPDSLLKDGLSVDLSYNNFTWQGPDQPTCRENIKRILPCMKDINCPKYGCSLHVNSGGNDLTLKENNTEVVYEGDANVEGGTAKYFRKINSYWGFSSTGDFMDDNDFQNARFIKNVPSTNISELYRTARLSPISLTYFRYCLENGDYTVNLHFAEIYFTNDNTYSSLGRRIFDIYVQGELVRKDFNIEDEAGGAQKQVMQPFNASVTDSILEIRFHWAGKGTTRIPNRGVYGPLISAISVNPNFKTCSNGKKKKATAYVAAVVVANPNLIPEDLRFKAMRDLNREKQSRNFSGSQTKSSMTNPTDISSSSTSVEDLYKVNMDSQSY